MPIIIIDNFQVDISNPIDNRFVVGSQSIPSGPNPVYPTPFYAYKQDIVYKYPGLRIWDFNDNVPYVWDGTQWINENTTGALVQNAATGNTGFENFVTKFANNTTLLTKSLLFDNTTHVGLGLTTPTPNNYSPSPISSSAPINGLHVSGNIKTNNYFIGNGQFINDIHAPNITTGYLSLARIFPPNPITPGLTYLLKNISGNTSWDLLTTIMPFTSAANSTLSPSLTNIYGNGGTVYQGISVDPLTGAGTLLFKPLVSTGLQITDNSDHIRIESKAGIDLGSTDGIKLYDGLDSSNIHKFRRIKSNSLKVSIDTNDNLSIESPDSGSSRALYVNMTYIPTFDDWKRAYDTNRLTTSSYIYGAGYYRGDGTQARPFTDSIKYDINGSFIESKSNTAIQNGLDFYIDEFGTVTTNPNNGAPTSRSNPSRGNELLTIQGSSTSYFFPGDFNIIYLKLSIQAANVISTTTGFLIDLDDTSIFPQSSAAWINITIEKDCLLEIRGNLVPDNDYLGGAGVIFPTVGGIQRNGGKGFRNSGSDLSTTNYSNNLHQIVFRGEGQILSLYRPNVGSSGAYGPSRQQNDNLFLFNLDENNNKSSTKPEYSGGPTPVIGYNNDGHICIQVDCSVYTRYQGIYMIGGKSKIEFTRSLGTGLLTDNYYGSTGNPPTPVGYLYDNDCYYAKGGLIRFFDAKISVGSGARKSYFIVEPELAKQAWSPKDNLGNNTGGDWHNGSIYTTPNVPGSTFYAYGTIGGAIPNLIFRNCRLGGPSINLFDKRTSGVATVDMLNCTSLYFSATNLVATTTTGTLSGGGNGGENWSGTVDQRWGCQWNPSQGWDLSKPVLIRDARKFNGNFTFKNNILEYSRININRVDLTNANGQSSMNTLGSQVVNTLQVFDSVSSAVSTNSQLQRGAQFLNYSTPPAGLVVGKSYFITNPGSTNNFSTNWYTKGYILSDLGTPAVGKMFNCTTASSFVGTASAREIKIDFVP
jgi:hypothetical protein